VKTEFLERVAHELRGPIGVTVGALDEIERALGADAERLQSQFAMARRGVSRVVRAADRLQRTAELERGDATFELADEDVVPIVERAANGARSIEARRKIGVEITSDPDGCIARVDAGWLESAVAEIVGNAIRFGRTRVSVDTRVSGGEVRITVRDDGPGFARAPSLERFATPVTRGGLGLSLPLVHSVVESHHGHLEFSPPAGAGSAADGGIQGAEASGGFVVLVLPASTSDALR
jgi:signal transduction histidine kinase